VATTNYLAIDLGSSNGRVLHAQWDGARFALHELHRFANGPINLMGTLHWDVLGLWAGVQEGLARYAAQHNQPLAGIAVDTWGVDFALLDANGRMLGNPVCYRDARTEGAFEQITALVPRDDIFATTGIQFTRINTLYQLWSLLDDPQLAIAHSMLMMPDLFHYWLTGQRTAEYTQASTSQCLHAHERRWATELLGRLGLPTHILPPIVQPGSVIGVLRGEVAARGAQL
jgi:rhamnulokinase